VVLLGALGFVAWRQTRALKGLADLSQVRAEQRLVLDERADLERYIRGLESRSRVVPEARRLLGMRIPNASEIVILPGEAQ
jgi:hypothetical protein